MTAQNTKKRKYSDDAFSPRLEKTFLDESTDKTNPREYISHATSVIRLKLIKKPSDFDDDSIAFSPQFTHQLFEKEIIRGYKNLRIDIYFTAASLATFLKISYDKIEAGPLPPVDVEMKIKKYLKGGYFTKKSDFLDALEEEQGFVPFGETIERYRRISKLPIPIENGDEAEAISEPDTDTSYELKLATFKTPGFKDIHDRMQFLLIFFIDASSFIDSSDSIWKILCLFERKENLRPKRVTKRAKSSKIKKASKLAKRDISNSAGDKNCKELKHVSYTFVGYCTLYNFFLFPDSSRLRISQILVLPPFQRLGHGGQFLQAISELAQNKNYTEINIEDPSDGFQFLRDLMDVSNCYKEGYFDYINDANFAEEIPKSVFEAVKEKFKITDIQIQRCFEILKLKYLDIANEQMYKKYRLGVKKRLYSIFYEELSVLTQTELKQKLAELYFDTERRYSLLLIKLSKPPKHIFQSIKTAFD